jgi:hypothetical protein
MSDSAAPVPEGLRRDRHVDAVHAQPWGRRAVLALFAIVVVAGLAGVFGQGPTVSSATAPAAALTVRVPDRLRGGDIYQARIEVAPRRDLAHPLLVLDSGWFEGVTLNSAEPNPSGEAQQRGGRTTLALPALHAGVPFTMWLQLQVNPTTVGTRSQGVALDDGSRRITRVNRTLFVFP